MSYAIINLVQKVLELLSKGDAKDTNERFFLDTQYNHM